MGQSITHPGFYIYISAETSGRQDFKSEGLLKWWTFQALWQAAVGRYLEKGRSWPFTFTWLTSLEQLPHSGPDPNTHVEPT